MSKKEENTNKENKPVFALGKDYLGDKMFGKRVVVSAIFYAFPSNLNASGGSGTNIISQKIIPWGEDAEPRVYVSPYALKRRIRDYWIKKGEKVYLREDRALTEKEESPNLDYIDIDLFGFMSASGGQSAATRPGAITTWGAVSLEPLHSFIDFNTNLLSTTGSEEGGSIINRGISKEFYFTSFFINPDIIGVDFYNDKQHISDDQRSKRLKLFFEALDYAMQKDSGGARDRPACIFKAAEVSKFGYGKSDKEIFKSIKVSNDKITLDLPGNVDLLTIDDKFVQIDPKKDKTSSLDELIKKIYTKSEP
jgi:CRISPR-associated autoregulator DevR family